MASLVGAQSRDRASLKEVAHSYLGTDSDGKVADASLRSSDHTKSMMPHLRLPVREPYRKQRMATRPDRLPLFSKCTGRSSSKINRA